MMEYTICLLVYLSIEYLDYLLAYSILFELPVTKNKKKVFLSAGILIMVHLMVLYTVGSEAAFASSVITMLVIPIFAVESKNKSKYILYPFVTITLSVIGVSISYILALIIDIPGYAVSEGNWYTIICECVPAVVMLALAVYRKDKDKAEYEVNLGARQYILFYIVVICLFFMLAPIQTLTVEKLTVKNANVAGLASSIASIVLVTVTLWQGIIVNREIRLVEEKKVNYKYMQLQKEYYDELLREDEKMRRFRHDVKFHLNVLQSMCYEHEYKDIEEYLQNIVTESSVYKVEVFTGNKCVDAIIRQMKANADTAEIDMQIKGHLLEDIHVKDYDICTLVSNLLKNAIEACERLEDTSKRYIEFKAAMYNSNIYITVSNSVKEKYLLKPKSDKKYHGLGIKNINAVVEKYGGSIEYLHDNKSFTVNVNL